MWKLILEYYVETLYSLSGIWLEYDNTCLLLNLIPVTGKVLTIWIGVTYRLYFGYAYKKLKMQLTQLTEPHDTGYVNATYLLFPLM